MDLGGIKEVQAIPLSDQDIRDYLPHVNIKKYSELKQYPTLHDMLPEVKSYVVVLYEDSLNKGHWTVVSRPQEGKVEFFCSYGTYPDGPLRWTDEEIRAGLGESKAYLTILFKNCEEEVVYSKTKYQKEGHGINDCGRYVILRTLKMLKGMNLTQFKAFMDAECRRLRGNYDAVVSTLIP